MIEISSKEMYRWHGDRYCTLEGTHEEKLEKLRKMGCTHWSDNGIGYMGKIQLQDT